MTIPEEVTPALLLQAYRAGLFPMAESRHAREIGWYAPERRGVLPIAQMHVPRRLQRTVRQSVFNITFDSAFETVIRRCADAREETWINDEIISLYTQLHQQGHAHSVEVWKNGGMAGGLYGIAIGGAFFGESMFSSARDASKVALVHLAARLWRQGFTLLDAQFTNAHLEQFGIEDVPRAAYQRRLAAAVAGDVSFYGLGDVSAGSPLVLAGSPSGSCSEENFSWGEAVSFLQAITQTS